MLVRLFQCASLTALATCAAVAAQAADLPTRKAPPILAVSGVTWDGFYVGVQRGYAVSTTKWRAPTGYYQLDYNAHGYNDGLLGGIRAGYNKQVGAMVLGVEADANAAMMKGYANCGAHPVMGGMGGGTGDVCGNRTEWIGSLTGRLGYAAGRTLFFVKAGGAFQRERSEISNLVLNPYLFNDPAFVSKKTSDRFGWTIGAGMAYALDAHWSATAEYGYYSFGGHTVAFPVPAVPATGTYRVSQAQHIAKFGLDYRFGGAGGDVAGPAISNDVTGEFGSRIGYSTGRFQKRLYDAFTPSQLNSVLTWPGQSGLASESFARFDHVSGVFLKGTFGGVSIGKHHMNDEDTAFAMFPDPYSNTRSATNNGRSVYGTADLGYTFLRRGGMDLGAFVGYGHYTQRVNAYGCTQVAAGGTVCVPAGSVNPSALTLSETEHWNALRLGLVGSVMLTERLKLSGEAAWLAHAKMNAKDNHWLRPDINPLSEKGDSSKGYQLEAVLSYAVTDRWSVGAGARYLSLKADGGVQFPYPIPRSPEKFESSRLTGFLQASYRFGDPAAVVAKY